MSIRGLSDSEARAKLADFEQDLKNQRIDFSISHDLSSLAGKGVLITGGASGIGAAIATALTAAGAYVVILDKNAEAGRALEQQQAGQGSRLKFIHCDITEYASILAAFKEAITFPPSKTLSHVLANAGCFGASMPYPTDPGYDITADPPEPALPSTTVSLLGMYHTVYLALHFLSAPPAANPDHEPLSASTTTSTAPPSPRSDDRSILLTGSALGYRGIWRGADYCMSKFGVRGIFKALRGDVRRDAGIRLNLLSPTFIATPLFPAGFDKSSVRFASMDLVIQAAGRCLVDQQVHGRSILIADYGIEDFGDDLEGLNGAPVMKDFIIRSRLPLEGS